MTGSYADAPTPERGSIPAPAGSDATQRRERQARARVGSAVRLSAAQAEALRGARLLFRQHGRSDLEELLANRLRPRPGAPVITVVGEAKRGKSTLVNALLGQRDLVPTGPDLTTGAFVEVHCAGAADEPGPEIGPEIDTATVTFVDGTSRAVPVAAIRDWVVVGGSRDPRAGDVAGVRLDAGSGRLPDAVLVDTPGAGGLDGGHARLALQACRRAALLVFVADAGQPVSAPELAFLVQASRSVERVVIALTKIDKYPAYPQIAAEIRALLSRHAPRFAAAAVVPVSGELALQAGAASGAPAAELDEYSGLPALLAEIDRALADRLELAVRNALRTAEHGLHEVRDGIEQGLAAARGEPGIGAAASAERAERVELREHQHTWSLHLDRDLRQARSSAVTQLARDADRLRDSWRERLERQRSAYSRPVAEEATVALRADLNALAGAAALDLRDQVAGVVADLIGREAAERLIPATPLDEPAGLGREAPAGLRKLLDPSLLLVANSAGAAGAAAMVHAGWIGATVVGGPPAWAMGIVGIPALALISLYRQGHAAQRRLSEWALEEINRVRTATVAALDDLLNVLKPEIVIAYRDLLASRIAVLDTIVKEALEAERSDAKDRRRRISELELQLAAVRAQQQAILALLG
jgi:Dynamin family